MTVFTTNTRRRPAAVLGAAGLGLAAVLAVAAPSTATPRSGAPATGAAASATTTTAAGSSSFRVAQFNLKRDNTDAEKRSDLAKVLKRADLVHVNEGTGSVALVRGVVDDLAAENPGRDFFVWSGEADAPGHAEEILLARKNQFEVLSGRQGSATFCDLNGSKPPFAKVVNWRTYLHTASGRKITHLGVHLPPSIERNGAPNPDKPANVACAEDQIDWIKKKAVRLSEDLSSNRVEIVVTGDLNIDYSKDRQAQTSGFPFVRFDERDLGANVPSLRSNWARFGAGGYPDTHGNRKIDYVYFWQRADHVRVLRMAEQQVLRATDLNSDHAAVVATMTIENR